MATQRGSDDGVAEDGLGEAADAMRRFNRFYTRQIGVLQEKLLDTPFSLTEARVIFELAQARSSTASALCRELGLDAGYLSRVLRGFEERGLIARTPSQSDARQSLLSLTKAGASSFAALDRRSREDVTGMLRALSREERHRLLAAMRGIERLLGGETRRTSAFLLRHARPGDMGWVVERHGRVFAAEYGFDETFEAFVAEIVAGFIRRRDGERERCWIAERDGDPVGSVFLMRQSKTVAKLRLLLVDPSARGLGIGERLVSECVRSARDAGYRKLTLWTQSILQAARGIYAAAGFRCVREEPHQSFGLDLVGEYWELEL